MNYTKHDKKTLPINRQQLYDNVFGVKGTVDTVVRRLLTSLGFKSKLLGTQYLKDAILYRYDNIDSLQVGMTTRAYVVVANTYNSTSTRVERAIRNSILNCYTYGALKAFNELAQAPVIDSKFPPSNGEFMCSVVNLLQLEIQSAETV